MQSFAEYLDAAHRSLNQHDGDLEQLWVERQREIEAREARLKAALIAILLLWPFGNDRRRKLQTRRRGVIRQVNRRAVNEVRRFERDILTLTTGGPTGWRPFRDRSTSTFDFARSTRHGHVWDGAALGRDAARELDRISGGRPTPRIPGEPAPRIAPRELPELDDEFRRRLLADDDDQGGDDLQPLPKSDDSPSADSLEALEGDELVGHIYEVLEAALDNPEGNTRNRSRQMTESVRDMSYDRTMSRAQVVEQVNGAGKANGFELNRNNMRLSTVTHARSAYRLAMLDYAERRGINHFMLEYPVSKRGSMKPGGAIARHAHQIRTLDQWSGVYKEAAKGKFSAANATLGFHHNDFTTLIPIPASMLDQARAYSSTSRGRLAKYLTRKAA